MFPNGKVGNMDSHHLRWAQGSKNNCPGYSVAHAARKRSGSKTSNTGDHFNATITTPVESGGKVVLPKGAEVLGKVVEAVPQGRFKGGAVLRLVLETVTVNKDSYDVQTSSVSRSLKGKGKRTPRRSAPSLPHSQQTSFDPASPNPQQNSRHPSFAKSGYLSPERSTYQARRTLLMRLITATISATRTITTAKT
jgi:hypothetical protein